jgi:hypothetical protein
MAIFGIGRTNALRKQLQEAQDKNLYLKACLCRCTEQPSDLGLDQSSNFC